MIRKLWLLCNMYVGRVPSVAEIREKSEILFIGKSRERINFYGKVKKTKSSQGNSKCHLCFTILYFTFVLNLLR